MKITLETTALTRELFKLQGIVSAKSTVPTGGNALLEAAADGTLSLYATDFDVSLSSTVPCGVDRPGIVAIRAKDLYDAVKDLKSDSITLEREDTMWLSLRAGTVKARLVGMDPANYPTRHDASRATFFTLRSTRVHKLIQRTLFAIATDEARPNLTGALFQITDLSRLQLTATDGHRLSRVSSPVDVDLATLPPSLSKGVIVPRKGFTELMRVLDLTDDELQVALLDNDIVFRHGRSTLFVRLIDGTYPNVGGVLPQEQEERKAYVNRSGLLDCVKYVSRFSAAKLHSIRLELTADQLVVQAQDNDKGEVVMDMPVTYSGNPVQVAYNHKFLTDVLNNVSGEQITLEIIDTIQPTVLHELEGEDGDQSLFIIMPMRI